MYDYFKGKLAEIQPTYAVVECGGVGYYANISLNTYSKISALSEVLLYVHLIVREDAHLIYGFSTKEERTIFRQLISVSGIGPNTASIMLSAMSVNEIVGAIQTGNIDAIKRVKGIGLKTAQRVIIELKDKMGAGTDVPVLVGMGVDNPAKEEALAALLALGFVKGAAQKVLDKLVASSPDASVEELIKQALKLL